jgi:hypothetical protein
MEVAAIVALIIFLYWREESDSNLDDELVE